MLLVLGRTIVNVDKRQEVRALLGVVLLEILLELREALSCLIVERQLFKTQQHQVIVPHGGRHYLCDDFILKVS